MWARSSLYDFWCLEASVREVKAHESDEGVDVLDGHGPSVFDLDLA
jgi:hypothetical protein